ncbi:hypothetical protein [Muriicola sp. Z0-33]|uniref:hypothetical protein n=1 Tax=Muriicola sp. Z0-33 TaxID=2816957 RepID=UPI00223847B9|nr:hypothetical protein [Muriicola sp. Z0-33]MCW5516465.1 hypothetical protein [Muriicola sp. Z0-33]
MGKKKRHWLWNLLIVLTIFVCILAFIAHYKNWTKIEGDHLRILSGVYYKEIKFNQIDSVVMVEKIPQMERINGFSAWAKEKGIFKDSLRPDISVRVYVDNLRQPKIKLVQNDSLLLYLNFSDSLETQRMYEMLSEKIEVLNALNTEPN